MQRENSYKKVLNLQDKVSILHVPARKANHDSPQYVKAGFVILPVNLPSILSQKSLRKHVHLKLKDSKHSIFSVMNSHVAFSPRDTATTSI